MPPKNRYNITFTELPEPDIRLSQMIIFDRKTNKTIRLKIPAKYTNKPYPYFLDMSYSLDSIQNYAKYKKEPQSVTLLEEMLYFQKTARFLFQNSINLNEILTENIWEVYNA